MAIEKLLKKEKGQRRSKALDCGELLDKLCPKEERESGEEPVEQVPVDDTCTRKLPMWLWDFSVGFPRKAKIPHGLAPLFL